MNKQIGILLATVMLIFGMVGMSNAAPVQYSGNGHCGMKR